MIWIIFIAFTLLSVLVQNTLQSRFEKYSRVPLQLTGAEVARKMLADHGIRDVEVKCIKGMLTDHYDPTRKVVNLSESVYNSASIAAAAVAAHECGHVVQHDTAYAPLKMRTALVPIVNFASNVVQWVLLAGVLLINLFPNLIWIGIALFGVTVLFSLITLPVEINASSRALDWLDISGISNFETAPMARDALKWAAYTYIIAALSSLATLLYYVMIALGASRRN